MLALVVDHLTASGRFTAVQAAESIEMLTGLAPAAEDGTVFVVPWRERARPPRNATGGHQQLVETQFVTVMVIRQYDDAVGSDRAKRFDTFKAQVEAELAGWQPTAGSDVVSLVGGEGQSLSNSVSIYAQTWQTTRFLTGAQ